MWSERFVSDRVFACLRTSPASLLPAVDAGYSAGLFLVFMESCVSSTLCHFTRRTGFVKTQSNANALLLPIGSSIIAEYTLLPIVVPAGSSMVLLGKEFTVRVWVRLVRFAAEQRQD